MPIDKKPDPETLHYASSTPPQSPNPAPGCLRPFTITMLFCSTSSAIAIPLVHNRADDPIVDGAGVLACFGSVFLFAGLALYTSWKDTRIRRVLWWAAVLNAIGAIYGFSIALGS